MSFCLDLAFTLRLRTIVLKRFKTESAGIQLCVSIAFTVFFNGFTLLFDVVSLIVFGRPY